MRLSLLLQLSSLWALILVFLYLQPVFVNLCKVFAKFLWKSLCIFNFFLLKGMNANRYDEYISLSYTAKQAWEKLLLLYFVSCSVSVTCPDVWKTSLFCSLEVGDHCMLVMEFVIVSSCLWIKCDNIVIGLSSWEVNPPVLECFTCLGRSQLKRWWTLQTLFSFVILLLSLFSKIGKPAGSLSCNTVHWYINKKQNRQTVFCPKTTIKTLFASLFPSTICLAYSSPNCKWRSE